MPNWCENSLEVSGSKEELDRFVKFFDGGKDLFRRVKPYPKVFEELDELVGETIGDLKADARRKLEKYGLPESGLKFEIDKWFSGLKDEAPAHHNHGFGYNNGGYDWCADLEGWGTKWDLDPSDVNVRFWDDEVGISFMTAWSPPEPIIVELSSMFPELFFKLEYVEPGVGFLGRFVCEGGEILENECEDVIYEDCESCGAENGWQWDDLDHESGHCWECGAEK